MSFILKLFDRDNDHDDSIINVINNHLNFYQVKICKNSCVDTLFEL